MTAVPTLAMVPLKLPAPTLMVAVVAAVELLIVPAPFKVPSPTETPATCKILLALTVHVALALPAVALLNRTGRMPLTALMLIVPLKPLLSPDSCRTQTPAPDCVGSRFNVAPEAPVMLAATRLVMLLSPPTMGFCVWLRVALPLTVMLLLTAPVPCVPATLRFKRLPSARLMAALETMAPLVAVSY